MKTTESYFATCKICATYTFFYTNRKIENEITNTQDYSINELYKFKSVYSEFILTYRSAFYIVVSSRLDVFCSTTILELFQIIPYSLGFLFIG